MDPYWLKLQQELLAANPDLTVLPRCHGCAGLFPPEALGEDGFCRFCEAEIKQQPTDLTRPAA